jgi:hypothetical protein
MHFIFSYGGNYYVIEIIERSQSFSRSPSCFTVQMAAPQLVLKWQTKHAAEPLRSDERFVGEIVALGTSGGF